MSLFINEPKTKTVSVEALSEIMTKPINIVYNNFTFHFFINYRVKMYVSHYQMSINKTWISSIVINVYGSVIYFQSK